VSEPAPPFGGVAPAELAATYGTPLLVLDTGVLDATLQRFGELGAELGIDVAYAGKALLIVALAERLAASPLGLDVCSLGELLVAERAGFPAARITFHGCGKTDEELRAAAAGRTGRIVVDHLDELERLIALPVAAPPLRVFLRLNPGIEAETHRYVQTGGEGSKFGFVAEQLEGAIALLLGAPRVQLTGLHCHLGSNLFDSAPYLAALDRLFEVYVRARELGGPLRELIVGGGFGVDPQPNGEALDVDSILRALAARVALLAAEARVPVPRLGVEPGRAIVAAAGTSLYRIVTVKHHGTRRFAIVDGGLADNPRPALYDAYHHPQACGRSFASELEETIVCGRSCENDELAVAALPTDLHAGDFLALRTTGAYTFSMASNYNRFPRPAVVFAGQGRHRLVVRRETPAELLEHDVVAGR
jgi:diaminopimelate decarboxylase